MPSAAARANTNRSTSDDPPCILDTDILSEYLKGYNATVTGRAAQYAHEHGVFSFTSVSVHEIVYGLEIKGATAQLQRMKAWLRRNDEITPVAMRLGRPVITGNTDDFRAIQSTGVPLVIDNWREP